jgi:hypothetical protein
MPVVSWTHYLASHPMDKALQAVIERIATYSFNLFIHLFLIDVYIYIFSRA